MTNPDPPTLAMAIRMCLSNQDFMREYRRLSGHSLGRGAPLDRMIDKATGKLDEEAKELFNFIRDYVLPVLRESLK